MKTVEDIIKAIDDELISSKKEYLLLGQANQLLVNQGIISIPEKSAKKLKKILEEHKIPHAYQTKYSPKQWRIPLSKKGELIKKNIVKRKSAENNLNQNNSNLTVCPACGFDLFVPNEIINESYIKCPTCCKNIRNPLKKSLDLTGTKGTELKIVVMVVIIIFLFFVFNSNNDSGFAELCFKLIFSFLIFGGLMKLGSYFLKKSIVNKNRGIWDPTSFPIGIIILIIGFGLLITFLFNL